MEGSERGMEGSSGEQPKLEVIESLMDAKCKAWCVEIECKMQRRMMVKLRREQQN